MKIIKLGDFNFRFICPDCRTKFEIESKELQKDEDGYYTGYYIDCPLCKHIIAIDDENEIVKFAKKRKEAENEK